MTNDDILLDVQQLSLDFGSPRGRVHALREVSLQVPRRSIVGVVGESGSGKSTLASAVTGLLPENAEITQGKIDFEGRDLLRLTPGQMRALRGRQMSMIFQDPMTALNPVRTIGRMMRDIQYRDRISTEEKRSRAVAMLQRVGIPDAADRLQAFPHQFSGGMRQRICIAMALLVQPALLLADEPTTALDATLEVQIIELLKALQRDIGCSILFVSHHLGVIAELCEQVVVMYAGEVIESGSVRQLFYEARHPYTQALLACDPGRIKERTRHLPTISGDVPNLTRLPQGCIFRPRCPHAFDKCAALRPILQHAGPGHEAACHLLKGEAA